MTAVKSERDSDHVVTLTLDLPGRSMNVLNEHLMKPFADEVQKFIADPTARGLIVTSGKDALGEVAVKVDFDGTVVPGKASSTDVVEASARAYLNALNRFVHPVHGQKVKEIGP